MCSDFFILICVNAATVSKRFEQHRRCWDSLLVESRTRDRKVAREFESR